MTSPLNEIEIGVTVNDDTAAGFASIASRAAAFRAAMQAGGGPGAPQAGELGLGSWARQAALVGATAAAPNAGRDMRTVLAQLRQGGAAHQDLLLTVRQLNTELNRTPASQGGTAGVGAAAAGIAAAVASAVTNAANAASPAPVGGSPAAAAIAAAVAARQAGAGAPAAAVAARLAGAAAGGSYPGVAPVAAAAAGGAAGRGGRGGWGWFGAVAGAAPVPLFGGAFGTTGILASIGAVHLLGQAIIETAGTLIPAALAFAAFGAAAIGPVTDIYTRMSNLHTVVTATGQSMYPFGSQLADIQNAVKPQVMLLFGDALEIMGKKGSAFSKFAQQGGTALDTLAARFTAAATRGAGFSAFLSHAGQDLLGWGNLVGNIGGIVGNFLKQVPGYAEKLLTFAVGVTHVAETITGSGIGQGIIGAGLAAHGALIYMGLGVTAASWAIRGSLGLLSGWSLSAGNALANTTRLGAATRAAGVWMAGFGMQAGRAAALPWGWILIAAAGIGFLAYKLLTLKDATQQWIGSVQAAVNDASAGRGMAALMVAQTEVANRLAVALNQVAAAGRADFGVGARSLTGAQLQYISVTTGANPRARSGSPSAVAATSVTELTAAQQQLADQTALYTYRLGRLGIMFGGVTAAQGLLTAAGIKMSQMLDKSQWPMILQQVQAVANAYTAMGQRGGILGADLNALTIAGSDQVKAMGQLNQAWDATFAIVTGGQTSLITFEQSLQALAPLAQAAGASMGGLNAQSLSLRSAWQAAFQNAVKLADAARSLMSGGATGLPLVQTLKDMIAGLIPLGRQSAATRAELVSLAQQVAPKSVQNWQELVRWLGNTKNAQQDLNKIMARSGTDIQNLAADAAQLAGIMQSQVSAAFSRSKLASSGFNAGLSNLTNVMKTNAASSPAVQRAAGALADVMVNKLGYSAKVATAFIGMLGVKLLSLPKSVTSHVGVSGVGAAMSQLQAYEALLSRAGGFYQAQVNAGVGVLKTPAPGAHPTTPGPPPHKIGAAHGASYGWHGGGSHTHHITLSIDRGSYGAELMKCIKFQVRTEGGGDVQTTYGD